MALNFPNNPSVNDTVELGGKTYQWDGVKWRMVYVVTPTPPTAQTLAPTITEVSTTDTSITFTITNNDASTAVILYEVDDATPDENSVELAAAATSSNITITGLTEDVEYDVYATANVTGKVKSNVTTIAITTVAPFVYTAATGGTTAEYDDGGKRFKSHTFTSNGNFVVSTVGDNIDDRNKVDYLIIAGGGSGGSGEWGGHGGGGAGGYRTTLGTSGGNSSAESKVTVTATSYGVTIGAGGPGSNTISSNGLNSEALEKVSIGGGGGSYYTNQSFNGGNGGSGGGGFATIGQNGQRGLGTEGQGHDGGNVGVSQGITSSGGGGAGSLGADGPGGSGTSGNGGNGLTSNISGSNICRAGGGGGGAFYGGIPSSSSICGGAAGTTNNGIAATVNTGGGGGGSGLSSSGGNGGSGLVVIRYEIAPSV